VRVDHLVVQLLPRRPLAREPSGDRAPSFETFLVFRLAAEAGERGV
jgi:hypothetical protein